MKRSWTDIEEKKLCEAYPTTEWPMLESMFPTHTHGGIKTRAAKLCLKRAADFVQNKSDFWTLEKEIELIELYPHHTAKEIAKKIGTTPAAVKNRAFKLNQSKETNTGAFKKGHVPANKGIQKIKN